MPARIVCRAAKAAIVSILLAGAPVAQTFSASPAAGTASLRPGAEFAQDITLAVSATGAPVENEAGCPGTFNLARPELNLNVQGAARPLRVYVRSSHDTVLMARTPAGEWLCNDDTDGLNPALLLEPAQPGVYHVWVAPYFSEDGGEVPITVYADAGAEAGPIHAARPAGGSARTGSFSPDPREVALEIGGEASIPTCPGFYSAAPSFNLNYTGDGPLYVYARAGDEENDLTLAVSMPDGTWECNDDAEGLNPGLAFERAIEGLYGIWVGSYRSRARTESAPTGTLFLSGVEGPEASAEMFDEHDFEDIDFPEGYSGGEGMARDGSPASGTLTYSGGPAARVDVEAGGPAPNPVVGIGCAGYLDPARPTAVLEFGGGSNLAVWAISDADATIVVGLPDGGWICNDDYQSLNPAVVIESAAAGRYPVWVGTFRDDESAAATLFAGPEPFGD